MKLKSKKRYRRHKGIRAKVIGTDKRPRLCVFRSLKYIYAQLINDDKNETYTIVRYESPLLLNEEVA